MRRRAAFHGVVVSLSTDRRIRIVPPGDIEEVGGTIADASLIPDLFIASARLSPRKMSDELRAGQVAK